jgi:hypothetical protein
MHRLDAHGCGRRPHFRGSQRRHSRRDGHYDVGALFDDRFGSFRFVECWLRLAHRTLGMDAASRINGLVANRAAHPRGNRRVEVLGIHPRSSVLIEEKKWKNGPLGTDDRIESDARKAAVNAHNLHVHGGLFPVRYNRPIPVRPSVGLVAASSAATITAASATAVASAATTTAAAATTTTTAAITAPAAAALFTRAGFVDCEAPTVELPLVKPLDCCLGLSVVVHLDKTKALAPARRAILDHLRALHGAELREQLFQG